MNRQANFPIRVIRIALNQVREYLVHLTILIVMTGGWAAAWSQQLEDTNRHISIPPLRNTDLDPLRQKRNAARQVPRHDPAAITLTR